ncbi:Mariner Mos1 transposase, partial [Acromyrmex echinatior]
LILLHDNARPHVAKPVKKYLEGAKWEILPTRRIHRTLPLHFHLFRFMQSALSGERFNSYEGIKKWLDEWIASKEPDFFIRGFFIQSVYYRKGGRKLSLPKEHTLNKLTYIDLFK